MKAISGEYKLTKNLDVLAEIKKYLIHWEIYHVYSHGKKENHYEEFNVSEVESGNGKADKLASIGF